MTAPIKLSELRAVRKRLADNPGSVEYVRTYFNEDLSNGLLATHAAADALIELAEAAREYLKWRTAKGGGGINDRRRDATDRLSKALARFEP